MTRVIEKKNVNYSFNAVSLPVCFDIAFSTPNANGISKSPV